MGTSTNHYNTLKRSTRQLLGCLATLLFVMVLPASGVSRAVGAAQAECYDYGDLRIVLTWDTNMTDIDLHTYDPIGNHAWYGNLGGIPGGRLDYDDVDGFGPETFTMAEPITGTYQIVIHYFDDHNSSALLHEPGTASPEAEALQRATLRNQKITAPLAGPNRANATATTATVRVFVGSVLKFSASQTLTGIGQTWNAHAFTICGGKPVIVDVKPKYKLDNTRFLEGISVANEIKVKVNWLGSTPGRVEFKLNNEIIASQDASGSDIAHTLDMGTQLQAARNTLEIVAYADGDEGQSSDPKTFQFYSIPQPLWIAGLVNFGLGSLPVMASGNTGASASDEYKLTFSLPNEPFSIKALRYGPPDGTVKFDWKVEGEFVIPTACSIAPKAELSAKGGIKFWTSAIDLTGYGGIESQRSAACGFNAPNGFAGAKIEYTGNLYSKPVLVMVSYFNVVLGATVDTIIVVFNLEEFVAKLGEFYVDGTIGIDTKTQIEFKDSAGQFLEFKDLDLEGSVGIQGGYRSDLVVVEVDVYAGANGTVAFARPGVISVPITENWEFNNITLKGEVGAEFRAFWFQREAKGEISWTYPPTSAQLAAFAQQMQVSDWQLIPPMTLTAQPMLQLSANAGRAFAPASEQLGLAASVGAQATVTEVLVSNVYTYPEVALALNPVDDQALLLWANTDNTKAVGQAQEIFSSRWTGASWTAPAQFTNDTQLDGAPQVAWAGDGQAVALWHRLNTVLSADAALTTTTTQQIEIATARFDPNTATWSAVTFLTNNSVFDAMPSLARNPTGQLIGAWRRNDSGRLIGNATNPDQVMVAFYNNGWGTPALAIDNIPGLLDLGVGYGDQVAALAYTRNITPTGSITPTAQLFLSTWDGLAWSAPTQLTNDTLNHRDPQLQYNAANQPLLVWLAGDELNLRNLSTNVVTTLPLPQTRNGIDEFYVLRDQTDNLVAVFVTKNLPRDIFVTFYDTQFNLWSEPRRLTNDGASEAYLAPTLDSQNRLLMGYATTAIDLVEKTQIENGMSITYTVPQPTQTDLATLSHTFVRNLTLTNPDLTTSQRNPDPSNSIVLTATVHNSGDKPVANLVVNFYANDPGFGALIHTASVPGPIPGNTTLVFTTTYTVADTIESIYVTVDPNGTVDESDEFDNQAQLLLIGPDLEILSTNVRYWGGSNADLITTVRNKGLAGMPESTLAYVIEDANNTEIVAERIPGLAVGSVVTIATYLDLSTFTPGRYAMLAEARPTTVEDFDASNNRTQFLLQILPDLHVAPQTVSATLLSAPTAVVSATIANYGAAAASAVNVGLYRSKDIANSAALLALEPLIAIPANGEVYLTKQVSGPLCTLYIVVDPDNSLDELAKANNVAAMTQAGARCVDFNFSPETTAPAQPPYTVQFTDFSLGNNTGWRWDFGDGNSSTVQNPRHTYMTAGIYTVTLTVSGPDGSSSLARTGLIEITAAPNRTPVANNDGATTARNVAVTIKVLDNDTDPDSDLLTVTTVAAPQHGTATTDGTTITYTPQAGFSGTDTFAYTVVDSRNAAATATVTVQVVAPNQLPTARDDSFSVEANSSNNELTVLSNDNDPDGDAVALHSLTLAQHGVATIDGGVIHYTPTAEFVGTDTFVYTIEDAKGMTANASVTITVVPVTGQTPNRTIYLPLIQR